MGLMGLPHNAPEQIQILEWVAIDKPASMDVKHNKITPFSNTALAYKLCSSLCNINRLLFTILASISHLVSLALERHPVPTPTIIPFKLVILDPLGLLFG